MRSQLIAIALALSLGSGAGLAGELPDLKLRSLAGASLQWPADLPADGAILLLVHDEDQQPQARSWTDFLAAADSAALASIPYFIVPVVPRRLTIVRSVVESAIRNAAETPADLARTVPLFADSASLQEAMGLPLTKDVQVVLVDSAGGIRAAFAGPYTDAAGAALRDAAAGN